MPTQDKTSNTVVRSFLLKQIKNINTREAYGRALKRFTGWCRIQKVPMLKVVHSHMAEYTLDLSRRYKFASVQLHLSAIKSLFDWLMIQGIASANPASAVIGTAPLARSTQPTAILSSTEVLQLLASIDVRKVIGLRDRALLGLAVYCFARAGEVLAMDVSDFFLQDESWYFRFRAQKGEREISGHPIAVQYCREFVATCEIESGPLFGTFNRQLQLSRKRLSASNLFYLIERRRKKAMITQRLSFDTLRRVGIVHFLAAGGSLAEARMLAGHKCQRTTALYFGETGQLHGLSHSQFTYDDSSKPSSHLQDFIAQSDIFNLDLGPDKEV